MVGISCSYGRFAHGGCMMINGDFEPPGGRKTPALAPSLRPVSRLLILLHREEHEAVSRRSAEGVAVHERHPTLPVGEGGDAVSLHHRPRPFLHPRSAACSGALRAARCGWGCQRPSALRSGAEPGRPGSAFPRPGSLGSPCMGWRLPSRV